MMYHKKIPQKVALANRKKPWSYELMKRFNETGCWGEGIHWLFYDLIKEPLTVMEILCFVGGASGSGSNKGGSNSEGVAVAVEMAVVLAF